jgi:glycosyltransferase involved in cell wall biosynthesis
MKVLVISRGVVGRDMGSSGVRSYHIARVLAEQLPDAEVTLAVPNEPNIPSPHKRMRIVRISGAREGARAVREHDVILGRDLPPYTFPFFNSKTFVLDLYAVLPIEWMAISHRLLHAPDRKVWTTYAQHYVNLQLTMADYVLCSSEEQRDVWVGALASLGMIVPTTYDRDPTLRSLIDVAPYGVRPNPPAHGRNVLKGVVPGIREDDKVLIWNGSIVEWFDSDTVIRAVAKIAEVRDDVKLFFLGTEHPDLVTGMLLDPPRKAVALAQELGVYDRSVFFNVGWVPYDETAGYLLEADIGVCAGFDNVEARVAFRTRYVDLFWAELPVVCTRGDALAVRIREAGAGAVTTPGDVAGFAAAVLRLLDDRTQYERARCASAALKSELTWERSLQPLLAFLRAGQSIAPAKTERRAAFAQRVVKYAWWYARQRRALSRATA